MFESLANCYGSAYCHRQQESDGRLIGMMERQHRKQPVIRSQTYIRGHGIYIVSQVRIGDHYPFGCGSGPAGEYEQGKSIRVYLYVHVLFITHASEEFSFFHHIVKAHEPAIKFFIRIHFHEKSDTWAVIGHLFYLVSLSG